jgi:hypothetical protein
VTNRQKSKWHSAFGNRGQKAKYFFPTANTSQVFKIIENHNLFCFEKCHGVVNIKNMAMKMVECLREALSMSAVDTKNLSIALKNKTKKPVGL